MPPSRGRRTVVIPAHGLGSRLRDVTLGLPKTLIEVGGEPILARLLRAVATLDDVRVLVYAQPGEERFDAFLATAAFGIPVELGRRSPQGYLRDLAHISATAGDEITVLDSDLVVPHDELCAYLHEAAVRPPGEWLLFGVSATPPSADPRSIRPTIGPDGAVRLAPGAAAEVPRSMGAYHWRPAAMADARRFVARGHGSFHDYCEQLERHGRRVGLIEFTAALNVNTRAELDLAEATVRGWRVAGVG
jgi:hypothetical protein